MVSVHFKELVDGVSQTELNLRRDGQPPKEMVNRLDNQKMAEAEKCPGRFPLQTPNDEKCCSANQDSEQMVGSEIWLRVTFLPGIAWGRKSTFRRRV
jgi:hypothetical protein